MIDYFKESFDLPNPGLKAYFAIVRDGNDDEYRTTFYKGMTPSTVVGKWLPTLKQIEKVYPSLFVFENDLAKKVGPLSIMKPLSERLDDIDHYYDDILLPSKPVSQDAIDATLKEWSKLSGLQIRPQDTTALKMKKSTNSGSPYFTKRRIVVNKTMPFNFYWHNEQLYQNLAHSIYGAPAILGWRGQEGGPNPEDVKQRVVWMFPFAVNIAELQVYQPLIEQAQQHGLVPAWISMEAVDDNITQLFDTKGKQDDIICTDFTKFDQHFNQTCQDCTKTILGHILANGEDWLRHVYPIKYNIPLAYDWDKVRFGKHGMGSGSGGTNADETILHRTLQHEAAIHQNTILNPYSMCLGDDGVLTYPGIDVSSVVQTYSSHGLEMNESKQYVSKHDCVYLRRWHSDSYRNKEGVCVGVYATTRALGRLCEQERFYDDGSWSNKMVALRQLSIIENVKWHPLCDQFAEFCMKGDKYRLGIDIPGFLDDIETIAEEAIDLMPDFLGYTKSMQGGKDVASGISDWWIVKYLKSK